MELNKALKDVCQIKTTLDTISGKVDTLSGKIDAIQAILEKLEGCIDTDTNTVSVGVDDDA